MGKINQNTAIPLAEKLAVITGFLESQNAGNVEVILLEGAFAEALVVATAASRRHAQGLAEGIGRICRERGFGFMGMEGFENAQWILVDCNEIVINIFMDEFRNLYKLEELWAH